MHDKLPELGPKLRLAAGWRFEARMLDQDLTIDPCNLQNNTAHIVRDELHNVYEGCGFDSARNHVPWQTKLLPARFDLRRVFDVDET